MSRKTQPDAIILLAWLGLFGWRFGKQKGNRGCYEGLDAFRLRLGPFLHRKQKPVLTPLVTSTRSVGVGGLPSHAAGLTVGLTWTGPLH